MELYTL